MRVANWNPNRFDQEFENVSINRLLDASYVIKGDAVRKLRSQIGKGVTTGINRPVYKTGKYAGRYWTSREFGELIKSVRVTRKKTPSGRAFSKKRNIRVYAGHKKAYYADIFEWHNPFLRPAVTATLSRVEKIIGVRR